MKLSFQDSGPSLSVADLRRAEKAIGCALPNEYRRFLLEHNGGRPVPSGFRINWGEQEWAEGWDFGIVDCFLSIHNMQEDNLLTYFDWYRGRIPADTIVIAHDPGTNLILTRTGGQNRGNILFWMQDYESGNADYSNVGFVASDFASFIAALFSV